MDKYIDLAALGKVLLASLIAGVGLVAVFGVGLVGLSRHEGAMQDGVHSGGRGGSPAGLALAGACLLVVVAGVALGLYSIIAK